MCSDAREGREALAEHMRRLLIVALVVMVGLVGSCRQPRAPVSSAPLRILITNDDGLDFPGLAALAEALSSLGTVTVAAPRYDVSGASHGVTSDRPIPVETMERNGQTWFAIDARPVTCLRLAVETLLPERPDIVLSGINKGENLGTVTFYSATVAAAREAAFLGLPALAVHLARGADMDYRAAAEVVADIVRAVGREGVPKGTFLNVNVPNLPKESIKGVRVTRQDSRAPLEFFEKSGRADSGIEYKPSWKHLEPAGKDTDIWALRNGYVSISVLGFDQSAAAGRQAARSVRRLLRRLR